MQAPFPPYDYTLLDVHGAGAQRSDPKAGDPADYPVGHGPQGDVIRIFNYVRCVRDVSLTTGVGNDLPDVPVDHQIHNYPNPFNPSTEIVFTIAAESRVELVVYDSSGRCVKKLLQENLAAGEHRVVWDGCAMDNRLVPSGVYFAALSSSTGKGVTKMLLIK